MASEVGFFTVSTLYARCSNITKRGYHRFYGAGIPAMSKILCVAVAALLMTAMRISAHHAFAAEYDETRRVTVSGTVTRFEWTNPHAWLYVDEKDGSGKVTVW